MGVDVERWQGDNSPHIQEIARQKLRAERRASENKRVQDTHEPVSTGLDCSWCKNEMFDVYYQCKYHKMLFCKGCATKTGQFTRADFPICKKSRIDKINCIWERTNVSF